MSCLLRFVLYVNIETLLPACFKRIRIVKVKIYSLHLKDVSDKLKKQGQVSACLWSSEVDRQKMTSYKSGYIKFW